jgi:hypothetical protein
MMMMMMIIIIIMIIIIPQEPEGKMGSKNTAWTVSTEPG